MLKLKVKLTKILELKKLFTFFIIMFSCAIIAQNSNYIYDSGTLWHTGFYDILQETDTNAFNNFTFDKVDNALMWDRQANNGNGAWTEPISWIYNLTYEDNITAEIRIRQSSLTKTKADELAEKYSNYMSLLPAVLRQGIKLINIMKVNGDVNFGGNNWNNSIDIYEGSLSDRLQLEGNMEEMLLHEGTHAALDYLYDNGDWFTERNKDSKFVSKYAYDNPNREDISETFAIWLALRNKENRLSTEDYNKVTTGLANRIAYLNSLEFDIYPIQEKSLSVNNFSSKNIKIYPNPIDNQINIDSKNKEVSAYVIYNLLGKKILEGKLDKHSFIDVNSLKSGVYLLMLDNNEKLKFIKK